MLKWIIRKRVLGTIGLTIAIIGGPIVFIVLLTSVIALSVSRQLGDKVDNPDPYLRELRIPRPQWTANGTWIVFFHGGVTHAVDAAGSTLVSLDSAIFPNVSPKGDRVAYTAYEHSSGWLPFRKDRNYDIVSSKLDGSNRLRLTNAFGFYTDPIWSPDGEHIAYLGLNEDFKQAVHIVRANGSDARIVAPSIVPPRLPPVWSPDGRSIAFLSDDEWEKIECRRDQLFSRSLYIGGVGESEPSSIGQSLQASLPEWSPGGRYVVFPRLSEMDCNLVELHAVAPGESASSTILTFPRRGTLPWLSEGISWSPDGSEILLGPLIVKADGSAMRSLPTPDGLASWSADGSRIAVHLPNGGANGFGVLYTMAADGSDIRVLVEHDEGGHLSAAGSRPLSYDPELIEQNRPCLELAEPGVLKHCDEE